MTKLLQASFTGGELAPSLHSRVDLKTYATGAETLKNVFVHPHGGASNRPGLQYLGETKTSSKTVRLIPFVYNTDDTYVLEFGDYYMRVWRDGGQILDGSVPYEIVTPYAYEDLSDLYYTQTANLMVLTHPDYAPRELSRSAHDAWSISVIAFNTANDGPTYISSTAHDMSATSMTIYYKVSYVDDNGRESKCSSTTSESVEVSWENEERVKVSWSAITSTVKNITGATQANPCVLTITAHGFNDGDEIDIDAVVGMTELNLNTYTVANATTNTVELEGVDSTGYTAYVSGGTATLPSGAKYYKLYKRDYGLYGLCAEREVTNFTDNNVAPDTSQGPLEIEDKFDTADDYPAVAAFYQQRLLAASSNTDPITIWGSMVGDYYNFNEHFPTVADDGWEVTMDVDQIHRVRHIVPMRDLLIMTAGGVHVMSAGEKAFTPANIKIVPQSFHGCSKVRPVRIGENALYVQERGGKVRDLGYSFENDAFVGNDLSVLANHLFEGKAIVDWAYAENPDGIIWCVLDDGVLLGLTYLREHEVFAWHQHETQGTVENVCVVPEDDEDAVYFVVNRTISGQTKRYVERLHTRSFTDVEDAFFVDSGLTYDSSPTTSLTGLSHLEGESVSVFADGDVIPGITVSGGSITLPEAKSTVHVGLPYTAEIKTLEPPVQVAEGTGVTITKSISNMVVRVQNSRGFKVGTSADTLTDAKWRTTEPWGDPHDLLTGEVELLMDGSWEESGKVVIQQTDPIPLTVVAVIPDESFGR